MTSFLDAQSRYDFFLEQIEEYVTAMTADYIRWDLKSFNIPLSHWYKAHQELEAFWAGLEG